MDYEEVPQTVGADEPMEEMGPTEAEPNDRSLEVPSTSVPRIRKVRITTPTPAPEPPHVYWHSRLQEHRDTRRAEKNDRYSNLRIY
jgi:hypothetical protein